jgi:hypothetical protein
VPQRRRRSCPRGGALGAAAPATPASGPACAWPPAAGRAWPPPSVRAHVQPGPEARAECRRPSRPREDSPRAPRPAPADPSVTFATGPASARAAVVSTGAVHRLLFTAALALVACKTARAARPPTRPLPVAEAYDRGSDFAGAWVGESNGVLGTARGPLARPGPLLRQVHVRRQPHAVRRQHASAPGRRPRRRRAAARQPGPVHLAGRPRRQGCRAGSSSTPATRPSPERSTPAASRARGRSSAASGSDLTPCGPE